jgi:hypothetical protein
MQPINLKKESMLTLKTLLCVIARFKFSAKPTTLTLVIPPFQLDLSGNYRPGVL